MDGAIVPIIYTAELVDLLEEGGIAPRDALRGTGLSSGQLRNSEELITHAQQ
ncbi:MAG: hypothetical protein ABGX04_15015 [Myxococcales bacterium]